MWHKYYRTAFWYYFSAPFNFCGEGRNRRNPNMALSISAEWSESPSFAAAGGSILKNM